MGAVMQNLGDAGASNADASYVGAQSDSVVSMDYYRSKIAEFQSTLNAVDTAQQAARDALASGVVDFDNAQALGDLLQDFEARKSTMRITGEAINMGAAAINAAGGRMPSLSIPQTLGIGFALPFAAVAAVGTAAVLINWGNTWLRGVNDRLKAAQLIAAQDSPEAAARLAQSIAQSDSALAIADASPLGSLAPYLKWGAIALGAFMVWRALQGIRKRSGD